MEQISLSHRRWKSAPFLMRWSRSLHLRRDGALCHLVGVEDCRSISNEMKLHRSILSRMEICSTLMIWSTSISSEMEWGKSENHQFNSTERGVYYPLSVKRNSAAKKKKKKICAKMMALHISRPFPSLPIPYPSSAKSRPSVKPKISCFVPHHNHSSKCRKEYTSVMIVPTGVGATIGGFAGDALPVARALSSVVDCLITHPNVLNAAMLYWPMPNVLYVEGYALDRFAEGFWGLKPVHQNKVGLVLDAGIEEELRIRHLQVTDAARASLGLPVVECIVTESPLKVEKWVDPKTGQSTGRIRNPDSLLRAVQTLINQAQVNAIAVVGCFPDDDVDDIDDYRQGMVSHIKVLQFEDEGLFSDYFIELSDSSVIRMRRDADAVYLLLPPFPFTLHVILVDDRITSPGIDILAGVEAVISHLLVKEFQIPCAHAPAMLPPPLTQYLSPKSAAEEIGYTFLPCVLAGLSNAPQYLIKNSESLEKSCILASDVDSVILPIDACGGDGVLAFATRKRNKPLIIVVEENETVLNDTPDKLGIEVIKVANYWEAIGVIAAHKAGINPNSLRRNRINNLRCTSVTLAATPIT
ncbi:hypothetical protein EZV62_018544 [Acer yangbiense]|uniref:Uncharacterized protein n=1 Tax=Acer yangbiense TaxID=1000413 RepID=A0A5C7HJN6_9ROSI|nr:hypothetical protein EZV62_018544 [Acer yangbiense]